MMCEVFCQCCCLVLLVVSTVATSGQSTITITTPSGKVTGLRQSKTIGPQEYTYNEFRRIPFAKAPVGDLRFRRPVEYGPWNNVYNATYFGPACIQATPSKILDSFTPNKTISEDCLFLNIYVPTNDQSTKKSVMVWIHGGSYLTGTGMLYDGAYLASVGDVIVVTVNYRLGVLGFLSTGNEIAVGNYGLWDQKMAIEWVRNNIEAFGGDTSSITIFGESAGGFSVSLHSLMPQNKGLFSRVIAQSGVATSYFAVEHKLLYYTNRLIEVLKCNSSKQESELQCLRTKTAADIQNAYQYLYNQPVADPHFYLVFAPRIDGDLILDEPNNLLRNKSSEAFSFFRSLDMIIGNVDSEGSLLLGGALQRLQSKYHFDINLGIPSSVLCDHITPTMAVDDYNSNTNVSSAACSEYTKTPYRSMDSVYYFGDLYFYSKSVDVLNTHCDGNSISKSFQYLSSRKTVLSKRTPLWFEGASHASELPLLFPFYNFLSNKSEDLHLSLSMMKYWSNFAKHGDPNGENLIIWPQYTVTNKAFQTLDIPIKTDYNLFKEREDFWLVTVPNIIHSSKIKNTTLNSVYSKTSFNMELSP